MKVFTRSQTQVLYNYLPGALFEHDRFGVCRVTDVICEPVNSVNRAALLTAVYEVLQSWRSPDGFFPPGYPDPRTEPDAFTAGVPREIRFEPFPTVLACQRCGHIATLEALSRQSGPACCPRPGCGGSFRPVPLVQIHNCGRIEPINLRECKKHGRADLTLHLSGRIATSTWRCRACGEATIGSMRMIPCDCTWSLQATRPYERFLRNVRTNDAGVYHVQTRSFVNLEESILKRLRQDEAAGGLLLARAWGILTEPVLPVVERRAAIQAQQAQDSGIDPVLQQLFAEVGEKHPLVKAYRAQKKVLPGQQAIEEVTGYLDRYAAQASPSRRLVEHVAIQDTVTGWGLADIERQAADRGDETTRLAIQEAGHFARRLGLAQIRALFNFPMALGAIGYTRGSGYPGRATLRPFTVPDAEGRAPVYVLAAETEAILFQLDPVRVVAWLIRNRLVAAPPPAASAIAAWAWLRRHVPGLNAERWQSEWDEPAGQRVRTLLHTLSHLLMRHIEWSGFSPESIGEYLLPETLTLVLYTNRYTGFTVGGLITLFEQRLLDWLSTVYTEGATCLYDPFCLDEGGSCAGCLHRRFNCETFNRDLSRAALYGGVGPDGVPIETGYWTMTDD